MLWVIDSESDVSKPNCFLFHNLVSCLVYAVQLSYRSTRTKSTIRLQIRHHYRIMPRLGNKGFHNSNLLYQQVYTCFIFNKAKKLINTTMTNIKTEPYLVLPPDKHASLQSAENFAFCSVFRTAICLLFRNVSLCLFLFQPPLTLGRKSFSERCPAPSLANGELTLAVQHQKRGSVSVRAHIKGRLAGTRVREGDKWSSKWKCRNNLGNQIW